MTDAIDKTEPPPGWRFGDNDPNWVVRPFDHGSLEDAWRVFEAAARIYNGPLRKCIVELEKVIVENEEEIVRLKMKIKDLEERLIVR